MCTKLIQWFSRHFLYLFLPMTVFAFLFCAPLQLIAIDALELSPAVSEASKTFSTEFCKSLNSGLTPEKSGEKTATQMAKSLFFSPVMNEIMTASKESLASSLSENIFNGCGKDLELSQQELNDYLTQLTNKIPSKSSRNFPVIQQRSSISSSRTRLINQ